MKYNLDPELQPWLAMLPDLDIRDLAGARAIMAGALPPITPPDGVAVEERFVPGPPGGPDVRVLVFSPAAAGPRPAMIYLHGGGFVLGSPEGEWELPALLAAEVGATVVSVDYRLAPEHPFPAAVEDSFAVLEWVVANAVELGVDLQHLGIGGISAGGGLAAATALLSRDRGGPAICFQLLEIPVLDDRLQTPSMQELVDTPLWNRPNAIESWKHYLGLLPEGEPVPSYAAPSRANDLAGLPPAYLSACEHDPLRDEGLAYAQRLVQAGVPTELHLYPGTFHGSGGLVPTASVSRRMRVEVIEAVRRGLTQRSAAAVAQESPAS